MPEDAGNRVEESPIADAAERIVRETGTPEVLARMGPTTSQTIKWVRQLERSASAVIAVARGPASQRMNSRLAYVQVLSLSNAITNPYRKAPWWKRVFPEPRGWPIGDRVDVYLESVLAGRGENDPEVRRLVARCLRLMQCAAIARSILLWAEPVGDGAFCGVIYRAAADVLQFGIGRRLASQPDGDAEE